MKKITFLLRIEGEKKISFAAKSEDNSAQDKVVLSFLHGSSFNSFGLILAFLKYRSFTNSIYRQFCFVENL